MRTKRTFLVREGAFWATTQQRAPGSFNPFPDNLVQATGGNLSINMEQYRIATYRITPSISNVNVHLMFTEHYSTEKDILPEFFSAHPVSWVQPNSECVGEF